MSSPSARPARTADVVIVGGGVTGCSIAFHLAEQGVRDVLVLERRFLAAGGTGRSVGVMRQLYPTDTSSRMVLHSLRVFQGFGEITGGDAGYVQCGAILAVGRDQRDALAWTVEAQRGLGIDTRLIGPDDIRELDPRIDPFAVGAAVWEPESGYGDPTGVTAGFARAAARGGVAIEQGAEVVGLEVAAGAIEAVRLASGDRIAARVVVNAAGLWSPVVAALAGVTLPIMVGRHPVFVVQRGSAFGRPHPVYLDLASGTFLRPETGGLTLTGFLDADEPNHPLDPEALGGDVAFDEVARIMERASRCIPALTEARYQRGYAGAFDITPDWMPVLDQTPVWGLYVAAGMSGHGFKLSPAVGRMMADLIIRGRSDLADLADFRLDRFTALPQDDGGAFSHSYLR